MKDVLRCEYLYKPDGDPWRRAGVTLVLSPSGSFSFNSEALWPTTVERLWIGQFERAIASGCRYVLEGEEPGFAFKAVTLAAVAYDDEGSSELAFFIAARNALAIALGLPAIGWITAGTIFGAIRSGTPSAG